MHASARASRLKHEVVVKSWAEWTRPELEAELRSRLVHGYGQVGGGFMFPNSAEGDLLKLAAAIVFRKDGDH